MNQIRQELSEAMLDVQLNAQTDGQQGLQQANDGTWTASLCLPSSFIGFQGHFPERPILPAVVQMLAGAVLAEKACGRRLEIAGISNAKFLQPLSSDMNISVQCTPKDAACGSVSIRLTTTEGVASSFSLQLTAAEGM